MIDFCIDEMFQQSNTLSFAIPSTDPKAADLVTDYILQYEGMPYYITSVIGDRQDEKAMLEIEAEINWMRLADIKRVGTFSMYPGVPAKTGVQAILQDTPWAANQTNLGGVDYVLEGNDASVLDLLWQWAKVTVGELQFDPTAKTVDLFDRVGADTGVSFRWGKNLKSIKRTASPPLATRIFPYGKDRLDITSVSSGGVTYIEDYSYYTAQGLTLTEAKDLYRKDYIYSDDSFSDAAQLLQAAQRLITSMAQPSVKYEASVVDLTEILGVSEGFFQCGDTVMVYDEPLGIDLACRVTRYKQYPYEPYRNEVELTFGDIILPDPNVSGARTSTSQTWELFESHNAQTIRKIMNGNTLLHRLVLNTTAGAEWVVGFKVSGIAYGTGNIIIEPTDDTEGSPIWPTETIPVVDGQRFEWAFTYAQKDIPVNQHVLVIRARSGDPAVGVVIQPLGTAMWVLAHGTTQTTATLPHSVRVDGHTDGVGGSSTLLWTVPDDVTEITVEAHGAASGNPATDTLGKNWGYGGMVTAKFTVVAGTQYMIYAGNKAGNNPGAPSGGVGAAANNSGSPGAGSSSVQPWFTGATYATTIANAIIVAGAAGGNGSADLGPVVSTGPTVRRQWYGGSGTFYGGTPSDAEGRPGSGGTQTTGGLGAWAGGTTDNGSLGFGGNGHNYGAAGYSEGGGGGGGWYGGGAADIDPNNGGGSSAGGGGGSGWIAANGFDLEILDASNNGNGWVIISWETVDEDV